MSSDGVWATLVDVVDWELSSVVMIGVDATHNRANLVHYLR